MRELRLRGLTSVILAWLGVWTATARGQCSTVYTTLEARITEADTVLVASIDTLRREVRVLPNGRSQDGLSTIPDGVVEFTLTLKVHETLKAKAKETVALRARTSAFDQRYAQWSKGKTRFLWFLGPEPEAAEKTEARSFTALRLEPAVEAEKGYKGDATPLFSRDLSVLKEPNEILDRARLFMQDAPHATRIHSILIPHALAARCSPPCDANTLVLPVEPSLEKLARKMVHSPREILPGLKALDPLTRWQLREGGVELLRNFESTENIQLLQSLLTDDTAVMQTSGDKDPGIRKYPLREKAAEILRSWNSAP